MNGTYAVTMGDRGRLVVPVEIRQQAGLAPGTPLILMVTASGVVMMTRDQVRSHVRHQLDGQDLVGELLTERRRASTVEDGAS